MVLAHDVDADARSFRDGLDDIGRQHEMAARGGSSGLATMPSATGTPAALKAILARALSIASAEASTP